MKEWKQKSKCSRTLEKVQLHTLMLPFKRYFLKLKLICKTRLIFLSMPCTHQFLDFCPIVFLEWQWAGRKGFVYIFHSSSFKTAKSQQISNIILLFNFCGPLSAVSEKGILKKEGMYQLIILFPNIKLFLK